VKLALLILAVPAVAEAGGIHGHVEDNTTGAPLELVRVVATAPDLHGEHAATTDSRGDYELELPPGAYTIRFSYGEAGMHRSVEVGETLVALDLELDRDAREPAFTDEELAELAPPAIIVNPGWHDPILPVVPCVCACPPRSQLQADLGLAVLGVAFERPIGEHYALQVEAQAFSTYFAPWFSAGERVDGFGGQVRATWFRNATHHGLYLAPYVRVDRVTHDMAAGVGFAAGGVAGYAFGAGPLDVRVGGGAQYMRYFAGPFGLSTPFVALDLVVGYRL
jgi:hypothetical protein